MESIVTKLLGSYLKRFITNFNKEMLTLQVMKGTCQIKDFAMNGDVLQELMAIPTNLEVVSARCTELNIKIPFMNLKNEPITFSLERIDIVLSEPETIKPMPNILQSMNKGNLSERAEKMSIIRGIKLELKECHMIVQTLGRDTFHSDWKPGLRIDISGMIVQSVNNKWELVPLAETQQVDTTRGVTLLYKLMTIHSISVYSTMTATETPVAILENLPAEIRSITHFDLKTNLWKSSSIEIIFEELNLSLTQGKWQRLANLGISLRSCFSREVPVRADVDPLLDDKANQLSYGLTLHRFVMEFLKGQQGGEEGFTFFGFGLQCSLSPARLIQYIVKDLGGRDADIPVTCWESIFNFKVQSVTFRERKPALDKEPQYARLLTQAADAKKEGVFVPQDPSLVVLKLFHRTKVEADEALKRRVPSFEVHASVHGVQVVFDKQAWKELYSFVIEGPVEDDIQEQGHKLKEKLKQKREEHTLADFKDYFYMNAKFDIEATETTFILPNIPDAKEEDLKTNALHFQIGKVAITNQPDWPFPPFLKDALTALPEKKEEYTPAEGTVHKFQGELHRVTCDLHTLGEEGEKVTPILYPAVFRLYGRYFPPRTLDLSTHKIEVMLHASELHSRITPTQVLYFHHLETENIEWGLKVEREERERRKMYKMMKAAASGVSEMKSTDDEESTSSQLIAKFKDNAPEMVTSTVKYVFDNIHATTFVRLEKAIFEMPSPGSWIAIFNQLHRRQEDGAEGQSEGTADKGKEKEIVEADKKQLEAEDALLCKLVFEKFEVVADNSGSSQSAVVKLKSVEARGLDHPRFPAGALIRPVPSFSGSADPHTLFFQVHRKAAATGEASIRLCSRLQGVQVVSVGKKGGIERSIRELIPELQAVIKKAIERYHRTAELRQKLGQKVKEGAEIGYAISQKFLEGGLEALNPSWRVEMGECEFKHVDSLDQIDADSETARGIVKLSSSNRDTFATQFREVEDQLINAKLALAQTQSEKFDMQTQVDQTEFRMHKLREEMKVLEQQLVNTKIQLAEIQAENDNLKTEIKKAQAGGGGSSTPTTAPKKGFGMFGRK